MDWIVSILDEEQWEIARDLRLAALAHDPDAFGAHHDEEAAFSEAQWRDFTLRHDVLVVAHGERYVATAHVETLDGDFGATCWLGGCWVAPSSRRSGVVRAMVDFMDAQVPRCPWRVQGLGVWEENVSAIAAYQALGFVTMGESVESTRRPPRRYVRMIRRAP